MFLKNSFISYARYILEFKHSTRNVRTDRKAVGFEMYQK